MMVQLQCSLFILFVLWFCSGECNKLCDLSDSVCLLKTSSKVYKSVVLGIEGLTKPLDPLQQDKLTVELPTLKYDLTNATLIGMKNCDVLSLALNLEDFVYSYEMKCAELMVTSSYAVIGVVGSGDIKTDGAFIISSENTAVNLKGKFTQLFDEKDKKLRMYMTSWDIDTINKGPVKFEISTSINGDAASTKALRKHHNDKEEDTEKLFKEIVNSFMDIYSNELNTFLKASPTEDLLKYE